MLDHGRPGSIGHSLAKHRGHGPGFDALRVYLSISVLAWHSLAVCGVDIMPNSHFVKLYH